MRRATCRDDHELAGERDTVHGMNAMPGTMAAVIAIVAIIGATVAVCLGHIDASAYSAIIGAGLGGGLGAGAHAAGVNQGTP